MLIAHCALDEKDDNWAPPKREKNYQREKKEKKEKISLKCPQDVLKLSLAEMLLTIFIYTFAVMLKISKSGWRGPKCLLGWSGTLIAINVVI